MRYTNSNEMILVLYGNQEEISTTFEELETWINFHLCEISASFKLETYVCYL